MISCADEYVIFAAGVEPGGQALGPIPLACWPHGLNLICVRQDKNNFDLEILSLLLSHAFALLGIKLCT